MRSKLSLVVLGIVAAAFVVTQIVAAGRQADTEKAVQANCTVVSVLLQNRADRKQTTKLFAPIRRQNPKQFDALVRKAEAGDRRLQRVQGDLACNVG